MPVPHCDPTKLAQLSAGEVSSDQALPHFSYKDNTETLDNMALFGFFDPVGEYLEVGCTIQLSGLVTEVTPPKVDFPSLVVRYKALAPVGGGSPYKWEIATSIGPGNSLYTGRHALPNQVQNPILQESQCKFKGFIRLDLPAIPPNVLYTREVTFDSSLSIVGSDIAWGIPAGTSTSPTLPVPIVLTDSWVQANDILSYRFVNYGAAATAIAALFIYTEVHAPLSPI